jgi:hypothetical protein
VAFSSFSSLDSEGFQVADSAICQQVFG